jgi:hypothetical protein
VASYLTSIAQRAAGRGSTLRPQRLLYAPSAAPPDLPAVERTGADVATPASAVATDDLPAATAPLAAPPAVGLVPKDFQRSMTPSAPPARPKSGGPRESREQAVIEETAPPAVNHPRTEPSAIDATLKDEPTTVPAATRPSPPARRRALRPADPLPDPLALALASAIRWTSSSDSPHPIAVVPGVPAPRETETVHAETPLQRPSSGPLAAPRQTAAPAKAPHTPVASRPAPAIVTPRGLPADSPSRSAPAPARQFSRIHIASVEVRVQAPAAPTPSPARVTAASSSAPATPLARGFTSSIGLRQG